MAGRGPAPKPADQKRRRNKPKKPEVTLPADGSAGEIPKLPATYPVRRWDASKNKHVTTRTPFLASTKSWYEAWAKSPMATEFVHVHWLRLCDIAILQDRWNRTGDLDVQKELRLQLAAFGGTPADLRRLGQAVEKPQPAAPAAASAASVAERRAAMRSTG